MIILRRPIPSVLVVALALLFAGALPAAAQKRNPNHTLLWRITGNGLERTSYIYGTMHITDDRVFDFGDSVLAKLQECETFAMEIIIDSVAGRIYNEAFSPDPNAADIRDWLDDEQEARLDTALRQAIGLSLEQLAHTRPWLLSIIAGWSAEEAEQGGDGRTPEPSGIPAPFHRPAIESQTVDLDSYLYRLARGEGKQVLALESIDEQLHLFDSIPFQQQVEFLLGGRSTVAPGAMGSHEYGETMITLYHRGDLEGLLALMQSPEMPEFFLRKLLVDRNHTMAERIVPQIRSSPTFIAVGAGHLPGPEGVLELLRQKGFRVTPVRASRTGLASQYREKPYKGVWRRFDDRPGAFSIELPAEPILMADDGEVDGIHSRRYLSLDVMRGITYGVSFFDRPPGRISGTDEALVDLMIDHSTGGGTIVSRTADEFGGTFLIRTSNGRMIRGRILVRGHRLYMTVAEGAWSLARTADVDRFTESFALLDYLPVPLEALASDTLMVEARVPGRVAYTTDTLYYPMQRIVTTGVASDTGSGYSYIIERHELSRFYRAEDRASLFDREIDDLLAPGDSVHKKVEMRHGDDSAVEVEIHATGQKSIRRIRLIQHGGSLYRVVLQMPREQAYAAASEEFFGSIRPTGKRSGDLFSSKLPIIITAIDGADSTLRIEAGRSLTTMRLDAGEREAIYGLLKRPRSDDTAGSESLRYMLLVALDDNSDRATIGELRKIYPTFADQPELREGLRMLLAGINTDESIAWLGDLLIEEKVHPEEFRFGLAYALAKNISTAGHLFPKVMPLLEHRHYRTSLAYVLLEALDSGVVSPASIAGERERLKAMTSTAVADTSGDLVWNAITGIRILAHLPGDDSTTALLRSITSAAGRDVAYAATLALLGSGQPVDRGTFERFAAAPLFRLDLYRELRKLDSADLFPRRYLSQHAISEAALVEWLVADNDLEPDSIVAVDTREVTVEGTRRRAYMFKFLYEGEEWKVGLGSLQPLDVETIDFTDEHATSNYNNVGDMSIRRHLDALLGR